VRRPPVTNHAGFVYFLRSRDRIKIGFSSNPLKRLTVLKTGMSHGIDSVAVVPGTEREERRAHKYLARFRQNGEWFDAHPAVIKVMIRSLTFGKITQEEANGGAINAGLSQNSVAHPEKAVARSRYVLGVATLSP